MAYGSLAVDSITNSDGFVIGGSGAAMKNRIINGGMVIDQRNNGSSVTPTASAYTLDRWELSIAVDSKLSVQQSSTAPTGFRNSVLITSTSAYTPSASNYMSYCQKVEGFNFADMMWGTANAKTVTLSFWVRSSLTGTFSGALQNDGAGRSYPFTFTILSANTFEYKTITIPGDTSGTWNTTNGKGVEVHFNMGSGSNLLGTAGAWASAWRTGATGSVSLVSTNGATFYLTGVQLEAGSQATSFDYRPYGTELQLCQRYCQIIAFGNEKPIPGGWSLNSSTEAYSDYQLVPTMRAAPTLTQTSTGYRLNSASFNGNSSSAITIDGDLTTTTSARITSPGYSGATAGQGCVVRTYNTSSSSYFGFVSEL